MIEEIATCYIRLRGVTIVIRTGVLLESVCYLLTKPSSPAVRLAVAGSTHGEMVHVTPEKIYKLRMAEGKKKMVRELAPRKLRGPMLP
jgi:hypothetical protein